MKIKKWKELERHPLSKEYKDIAGKAWDDMLANFREHGNMTGRRIMLFDGMILDGWQLFRACFECNVQPEFIQLPDGMDPAKYVETVNDRRRHETQDKAMERVEERRRRVVEARQKGESTRAIAEKEGITNTQVVRDLKAATVTGVTVQPTSGVVNSKDGVQRPAKSERSKPSVDREGKIRFNAKIVDDAFGEVVRSLSKAEDAWGKSPNHTDCRRHLDKAFESWKAWKDSQ